MFRRTMATAIATIILGACSGDSLGPVPVDPAPGLYSASADVDAAVFTTEREGETIDWLERGALLQLSLYDNGTTEGRLFVPGMNGDGGDMDEDLTGTWTKSGSTLHLQHSADTFLRDMPLTIEANRLVGDHTFSGTRVRVTLVR
jgi:hypothetical protein